MSLSFRIVCGCKPEQVRSRSEYIEDRIFQEVRKLIFTMSIMEFKHNLIRSVKDYKTDGTIFYKMCLWSALKGVRISGRIRIWWRNH